MEVLSADTLLLKDRLYRVSFLDQSYRHPPTQVPANKVPSQENLAILPADTVELL